MKPNNENNQSDKDSNHRQYDSRRAPSGTPVAKVGRGLSAPHSQNNSNWPTSSVCSDNKKEASFAGGERSGSVQLTSVVPFPEASNAESIFASEWTAKVLSLPSGYCLGHYVTLPLRQGGRSLKSVLSDLLKCFRRMSIHVQFGLEKAFILTLRTFDLVTMRLIIWTRHNGKEIVVDLHQIQGDQARFMRHVHQILRVATMGATHEDNGLHGNQHNIISPDDRRALQSFQTLLHQATEYELNHSGEPPPQLVLAHSLLTTSQQVLGLESLLLKLDPYRTTSQLAVLTCRIVLLGGVTIRTSVDHEEKTGTYESSMYREIHEVLLKVVHKHVIQQGTKAHPEVNRDRKNNDEFQLTLEVFARALQILALEHMLENNILPALSPLDVLEQFLFNAAALAQLDILDVLLSELKNANTRPHTACVAASCLRHFGAASMDVRRAIIVAGGVLFCKRGLKHGTFCHLMLEDACRELLDEIDRPEVE